MSDARALWHIDGYAAKLTCGSLLGQVEPAVLGEHFRVKQWRAKAIDGFQLLQIANDEPFDYNLVQRHARGCDLVDVFPKSAAQRISREACWRASFQAAHDAVQLELIYSTQTELLDSNPVSVIPTNVAGARVFHCQDLGAAQFNEVQPLDYPGVEFVNSTSRESLVLFRNASLGLSYAEMVHPTDYVSTQLFSNDGHLRSSVAVLFPERLEKGVIRRGRVCGWFLPVENDLRAAVELARQFVDQPLPLTT